MIYVIDFGSSKTPAIKACVEASGFVCVVKKWDENAVELENAKGVVLSGAPVLLTETTHTFYLQKLNEILQQLVPVLGICFGHQLLGLSYGAKIFRGAEVRTNTNITLLAQNSLFAGFDTSFVMSEDHTEGIDLPEGFVHLATSDEYEVEAMKHASKPFWGVQFHPEASGENGMKLFSNFSDICKNYSA